MGYDFFQLLKPEVASKNFFPTPTKFLLFCQIENPLITCIVVLACWVKNITKITKKIIYE